MKPGKHQSSKQRRQNLCWRSKTVHSLLFLFCSYTVHEFRNLNLLLVSSSVRRKELLCFVLKSEQKHTTRNFVGFHNHSSLLSLGVRCNNLTRFKRKILSFSGLIPFRITYFPTDLKPLSLCQMLAIDNIFTDTRPTSKNLLRFLFPSQAFNLQIDITQVFT